MTLNSLFLPYSIQPTRGSDIDPMHLHSKTKDTCFLDKFRSLYIDARTVDGNIPWDETGDVFNKVSPQ